MSLMKTAQIGIQAATDPNRNGTEVLQFGSEALITSIEMMEKLAKAERERAEKEVKFKKPGEKAEETEFKSENEQTNEKEQEVQFSDKNQKSIPPEIATEEKDKPVLDRSEQEMKNDNKKQPDISDNKVVQEDMVMEEIATDDVANKGKAKAEEVQFAKAPKTKEVQFEQDTKQDKTKAEEVKFKEDPDKANKKKTPDGKNKENKKDDLDISQKKVKNMDKMMSKGKNSKINSVEQALHQIDDKDKADKKKDTKKKDRGDDLLRA